MFSEHLCFCFVYFKQNSLTLFLVVSETLVSKTTKLNLCSSDIFGLREGEVGTLVVFRNLKTHPKPWVFFPPNFLNA